MSPTPSFEQILEYLAVTDSPSPPRVSAIAITSIDGRGAITGTSGALGNTTDATIFNTLRAHADAIVVGAATIRAEEYSAVEIDDAIASRRIARDQLPHVPIVTVSRSLDFPVDSPFVSSATRCSGSGSLHSNAVVYTTMPPSHSPDDCEYRHWQERREALAAHGVDVRVRQSIDIPQLITELNNQDLRHIVCEGGPTVYAQALRAGAVNEVFLTIAPYFLGDGPHTFGENSSRKERERNLEETQLRKFSLRAQLLCDSHIYLRYTMSTSD